MLLRYTENLRIGVKLYCLYKIILLYSYCLDCFSRRNFSLNSLLNFADPTSQHPEISKGMNICFL